MRRKFFVIFLVFGLLFLPARTYGADNTMVDSISSQLICQCGCTAVLNNCTHLECHIRESMTAQIKLQLDQGMTSQQIIQSFVTQYGEQVLSSPPKRGFNLTAWLLPFAAILAGGAVIYIALKKWVRLGARPPAVAADTADESNEAYRSRLEKELREFSGGGFR